MTDNRKAGTALIVGSLGGLVTMAIHPTSRGATTAAQLDHLSVVSGAAHSLAIVCVTLTLLGVLGLARFLAGADRLAFSGAVVYSLSACAILIAAAVSGFIVPQLMRHMIHDDPAYVGTWHIVIDAVFQINQAFSKIYSTAASVAILLFSAAILRGARMGKGLASYGCVIAPAIMLAIGTGHLRLDVHGMGTVVLGQSLWFIGAGLQLRKEAEGSVH